MAGPSRSAAASAAETTRQTAEMVTLPSGASYPKFLEPLTKNEQALLDSYERIKHYEKEAARLKAEEARRRLDEADERYRAKVKERERREGKVGDEEAEMDTEKPSSKEMEMKPEDGAPEGEESGDDEATERRRKRNEEISRLRKDVDERSKREAEKEAARKREEAMRLELMGGPDAKKKEQKVAEGEGGDETKKRKADIAEEGEKDEEEAPTTLKSTLAGPAIKKKRIESNPWDDARPKPSLIGNLDGGTTPLHDFSKTLGMSNASPDGTVLFPDEGQRAWEPPERPADFLDGCLELELDGFDPDGSGNNTLAIKFHAPHESKRFSVNIAGPDHGQYNDILFHFNPRHFQKGGQLILNTRKESMWGNDVSVPLSTLPLMFGVPACTLIVQINDEGFDVFVEGQHCARLEHRTLLPKGKGSLFLQLPSSDDYGNPEDWMAYRVWWGRKPSMVGADLSSVAGVNLYSSVHPRKLFVSGLPKLHSDPEVDLRRAELERAFRKYGGPSGAVSVSVQKGSTFAFVEVASEQQADLALLEMANRYRINKARRTKHEALMEERAAKEALESGGVAKESVDWD
ncbi:hypothetical protein ACHAXT_003391 [Thalassiosira profunda]